MAKGGLLGDSSNALLGLGAGLLGSAPTSGDRIRRGLLGFQEGAQVDRKAAQQEAIRRRRNEIASSIRDAATQKHSVPVPGVAGHPARAGATQQVGMPRQTQMRGLLASEAVRGGDFKTAYGLLSPDTPDEPSVVQTVRAMGLDPRSPEGQKLITQFETSGGVTVNNAPDWTPSGYMPRDPQDPSKGVDPIPGSPAARKAREQKQEAKEQQHKQARSEQLLSETHSLIGELITPEAQGGYRGGLESATGPMGQYVGGFSGEGAAAAARLDRVKALLTKENLNLMSGVLSESDIQILERIDAVLDRGQSDEAMFDELERLYVKFAEKTGNWDATNWGALSRNQILRLTDEQLDQMSPPARKKLSQRMDELGM